MNTAPKLHRLSRRVKAAYDLGSTFDLDHCIYGPTADAERGYIREAMPYYRFLAGFCAKIKAKTVVEVGTHYGGSTLAMLEGVRAGGAEDARIVTMDVTDLNRHRLAKEPEITKVIGDSTNIGFVRRVMGEIPNQEVDVLYIDALKSSNYVLETLHNFQEVGISPRWLILDDVQSNLSMVELWNKIEEVQSKNAFLISDDYPEIRSPDFGYGLIDVSKPRNLLQRAETLMTKLHGDASGFSLLDDLKTRKRLEDAVVLSGYVDEHPESNTTGATDGDLSLGHSLASRFYTGTGDIVELGAGPGAMTRALAEGLDENIRVPMKYARITAHDRFSADKPSALEDFFENIKAHTAKINVVDMLLNTAHWSGRPIEILVAGALRSPYINAHLYAEFSKAMLPGQSVLVIRDMFAPYRLWSATVFAWLGDHFDLVATNGTTAVAIFKSPIPPQMLRRVTENRFTPKERMEQVAAFGRGLDNQLHGFDFIMQAAWLAQKAGLEKSRDDLFEDLTERAAGLKSAVRRGRLKRFEKAIAATELAPQD